MEPSLVPSTDAPNQLHVLEHDSDPFRMNGCQLALLKKRHHVSLRCFLRKKGDKWLTFAKPQTQVFQKQQEMMQFAAEIPTCKASNASPVNRKVLPRSVAISLTRRWKLSFGISS